MVFGLEAGILKAQDYILMFLYSLTFYAFSLRKCLLFKQVKPSVTEAVILTKIPFQQAITLCTVGLKGLRLALVAVSIFSVYMHFLHTFHIFFADSKPQTYEIPNQSSMAIVCVVYVSWHPLNLCFSFAYTHILYSLSICFQLCNHIFSLYTISAFHLHINLTYYILL